MNNKLIKTISVLLVIIAAAAIGYQIGKKITKPNPCQTTKLLSPPSLFSLMNDFGKTPKNLTISAEILGNHKVCLKNYSEYQANFSPSQIYEEKIDILASILTKVNNCQLNGFVEFNPDDNPNLKVAPNCIAQDNHNVATCCYPYAMFIHLSYLQIFDKYEVYITKGKKIEKVNNSDKLITIFMFKTISADGKITYYDIVDDPTNYIPIGKEECK